MTATLSLRSNLITGDLIALLSPVWGVCVRVGWGEQVDPQTGRQKEGGDE